MTLTTVGYHTQPSTGLGKLTCGLCAVAGVFIITLPIPIVVSSFAQCYKGKLWRDELATRNCRQSKPNSQYLFIILLLKSTDGGKTVMGGDRRVLQEAAGCSRAAEPEIRYTFPPRDLRWDVRRARPQRGHQTAQLRPCGVREHDQISEQICHGIQGADR